MQHGRRFKILRNFSAAITGMMKCYYENHYITEDLLMLTHTPAEIKWLIDLHYIKEDV